MAQSTIVAIAEVPAAPPRNGASVSEIAALTVRHAEAGSLLVTVQTRNLLRAAPKLRIQLENGGTRAVAAVLGDDRRTCRAEIEIAGVLLEGIIEVRGAGPLAASVTAAEPFVATEYAEPGVYRLFGPRGRIALDVRVDFADTPFLLCLGPAATPSGAVAQMTAVLGPPGRLFGAPLSAAFAVPAEVSDTEVEVRGIADGTNEMFVVESVRHPGMLAASIKRPGAYGVFTKVIKKDGEPFSDSSAVERRLIELERRLETLTQTVTRLSGRDADLGLGKGGDRDATSGVGVRRRTW